VIFIGSSVGGAAVSQITGDVYSTSKELARKRFGKKEAQAGATAETRSAYVSFEIRNSENEILLYWKIDETGENEEDQRGHGN
jgi:hypothetical protein